MIEHHSNRDGSTLEQQFNVSDSDIRILLSSSSPISLFFIPASSSALLSPPQTWHKSRVGVAHNRFSSFCSSLSYDIPGPPSLVASRLEYIVYQEISP